MRDTYTVVVMYIVKTALVVQPCGMLRGAWQTSGVLAQHCTPQHSILACMLQIEV